MVDYETSIIRLIVRLNFFWSSSRRRSDGCESSRIERTACCRQLAHEERVSERARSGANLWLVNLCQAISPIIGFQSTGRARSWCVWPVEVECKPQRSVHAIQLSNLLITESSTLTFNCGAQRSRLNLGQTKAAGLEFDRSLQRTAAGAELAMLSMSCCWISKDEQFGRSKK